MEILGPAGESLRLAEHYRRLTDEELLALATRREELTELAQQALEQEISTRKLSAPSAGPPVATRPAPPPDFDKPDFDKEDEYAEERRLVEVGTVWSEADARRLQTLLNAWGIPFYIGPEKATSVDDVTSIFAEGIPMQVMQIGVPWAREAMRNYFPQDQPAEPELEDAGDVAVHCPKCHSEEVVFDDLVEQTAGAEAKYRWTCDACGYEWEDSGVETK
jgi:DNA-directed RNA polymerase subunit M/transcription elongation factor TFIIS